MTLRNILHLLKAIPGPDNPRPMSTLLLRGVLRTPTDNCTSSKRGMRPLRHHTCHSKKPGPHQRTTQRLLLAVIEAEAAISSNCHSVCTASSWRYSAPPDRRSGSASAPS